LKLPAVSSTVAIACLLTLNTRGGIDNDPVADIPVPGYSRTNQVAALEPVPVTVGRARHLGPFGAIKGLSVIGRGTIPATGTGWRKSGGGLLDRPPDLR
jgi:hypothetical protein